MNLKIGTLWIVGLSAVLLTGCLSYSPTATDWEVLFDGSSEQAQENFQGYYQPGSFPTGWGLDRDALKAIPGAKNADLMTRQMYSNFELDFEWAVAEGGNGGVIYNVIPSSEPPWQTGPEYQVLDDTGHADGKNPLTSAGALYDLIAPDVDAMTLPVGRFNQGRIIVNHGHVEHWLNGRKVVEYQWDSRPVQKLIAKSKFANLPGFMKSDHGYIVFQHHGEAVWYRKIRIRRL
ncbi:DUF1080 domain-containing protein [bacterium]|nr:DUF1080 domain-containing protein [bacterium]